MEITATQIPDVLAIRPRIFSDHRGFFLETWQERRFEAAGIRARFVQDNQSRSKQWTLRGLHYQIEQPQGKLVGVTQGAVFDVAVDLRRSSATFGQWVGMELNDVNHQMLWIPPGFAHGFLALSATVDFVYKCTDFYAPPFERTLRWNDPKLGIAWPIPNGVTPLIAEKDGAAGGIGDAELFP